MHDLARGARTAQTGLQPFSPPVFASIIPVKSRFHAALAIQIFVLRYAVCITLARARFQARAVEDRDFAATVVNQPALAQGSERYGDRAAQYAEEPGEFLVCQVEMRISSGGCPVIEVARDRNPLSGK